MYGIEMECMNIHIIANLEGIYLFHLLDLFTINNTYRMYVQSWFQCLNRKQILIKHDRVNVMNLYFTVFKFF
jgi:hypothetical protein